MLDRKYRFLDVEHFLSAVPSITALALVDYEPNDHWIRVLDGYVKLRETSVAVLTALGMPEYVCLEHASVRPDILVSINADRGNGRQRDKLIRHAESRGARVVIRDADFWSQWPGRIGKSAHLRSCASSIIGRAVMVTDMELNCAFIEDVFEQFVLAFINDVPQIVFWSLRDDFEPHVAVTGSWLLERGLLMDGMEDYYSFHRRRALFGGVQARRWKDGVPPGKFRTERFKVERVPTARDEEPGSHAWSLQSQIYGFFYNSASKPNAPRLVHCEL